jgi:hypothetical protein
MALGSEEKVEGSSGNPTWHSPEAASGACYTGVGTDWAVFQAQKVLGKFLNEGCLQKLCPQMNFHFSLKGSLGVPF